MNQLMKAKVCYLWLAQQVWIILLKHCLNGFIGVFNSTLQCLMKVSVLVMFL